MKTISLPPAVYRQGDLVLTKMDLVALPDGAERLPVPGGNNVLAIGEDDAQHVIDANCAQGYTTPDGAIYLRVAKAETPLVDLEDLSQLRLPIGIYRITYVNQHIEGNETNA